MKQSNRLKQIIFTTTLVVLGTIGLAFAADPNSIHLTVTREEYNYIQTQLAERPAKESLGLILKLNQQEQSQRDTTKKK